MSMIVAVGISLLVLLAVWRKDSFLLKAIPGVVTLLLLVLSLLAYNREDELFLSIPGTRIDNSAVTEVKKGGTFYLDSSQSAFMENKFFITGDNKDEMTAWLKDAPKSVYIYIADGSNIIYSRNMGRYRSGLEYTIWSTYSSYEKDGVVPAEGIRYWFLCFYMGVLDK